MKLRNVLLIWFAISLLFVGMMLVSVEDNVEHLSLQLTDMTPGADVHVNATVTPAPTVLSPLTQTPCIAARVDISYSFRSGKTTNTEHLFTQFIGPDPIPLLALNTPLALPRVLWNPDRDIWNGTSQELPSLPSPIATQIPPDRLAFALKKDPKHFTVQEWILTENMQVFVAGTLWGRDPSGAFILGPDPTLKKLILQPGTQTSIRANQNISNGRHSVGIFILLLGCALSVFFLYLKYTRSNPSNPPTTPPPPPSKTPE